jgi:hypothetical protein
MYMLPTAITTGSPFRGKMCYIGSSLRVYAGESPPQMVRVFDAQYLSVHKLKETKHRDHVNLHTCNCTLINCNSILRVIIHNTYYRHFIRLRDYAVNARTQIPRLHQFDFRSRIVIILLCTIRHQYIIAMFYIRVAHPAEIDLQYVMEFTSYNRGEQNILCTYNNIISNKYRYISININIRIVSNNRFPISYSTC